MKRKEKMIRQGGFLLSLMMIGSFLSVSVNAGIVVVGPAADYRDDQILIKYTSDGTAQFHTIQVPAGSTVPEVLAEYRDTSGVEYAEPDYIVRHCASDPNDIAYQLGYQWALYNEGQLIEGQKGTYSADMDVGDPTFSCAWDKARGSSSIVIAIIDTGVDLYHVDFGGNGSTIVGSVIWENTSDNNGDGVDDDTNGYIDDQYGWDFVNSCPVTSDDNGHGTHCAGIVGALTDNSLGISGVAGGWHPVAGCKIMPVKVMNSLGSGYYSDIASGIRYVVDMAKANSGHIFIINLSLGGSTDSMTLKEAIKYAYDNDVLVICAAGNDDDIISYPAAYSADGYCIAVGATDNRDQKASFSNYGSELDVVAPGVNIYSTVPPSVVTDNYTYKSGTSMAAPNVCGVAALLKSYSATSGLGIGELRGQLRYTAYNIDRTGAPRTSPEWDEFMGYGRVNGYSALTTTGTPCIDYLSHTIQDSSPDGDGDGIAEPGEFISLRVTLRNEWLNATGVTATLSTSDSYITVTDTSASFGTISGGTEATNSSDPFKFSIASKASGCPSKHRIEFTLSISATSPTYSTNTTFYAFVGKSILLVDDDGGYTYEDHYKDALDTLNAEYDNQYQYDTWTVYDPATRIDTPPRARVLNNYRIVIWATAYDYPDSVARLDRVSLMEYLEQGGRLFLTASNIIHEFGYGVVDDLMSHEKRAFLKGYLKVQESTDIPVSLYDTLSGVSGNSITDGMLFTIRYITGNPDSIIPTEDAMTILTYDEGGGAVLRHASHFGLVLSMMPFRCFADDVDPSNKNTLLKNIILWLDGLSLGGDEQKPSTPTELSATAGIEKITLNWNASPEPDVAGYYIYRQLSAATGLYSRLEKVSGLSYTDTDVSSGTTYYYNIAAVDEADNESDKSAAVSAAPTESEYFGTGGGGGSGGGCFIATTCYGDPRAEEVKILKAFRDRFLLTNMTGKKLLRFYCATSPPLANFIRNKEIMKAIIRKGLKPIVSLSKFLLNREK